MADGSLSRSELEKVLAGGQYLIVDARDEASFNTNCLPGAINVVVSLNSRCPASLRLNLSLSLRGVGLPVYLPA